MTAQKTVVFLSGNLACLHFSRFPRLLESKQRNLWVLWGVQKNFSCNLSVQMLVLSSGQSQNTHRVSTAVGFWRGKVPDKPYGECPGCLLKTPTLHTTQDVVDREIPSGWRPSLPGGQDPVTLSEIQNWQTGKSYLPGTYCVVVLVGGFEHVGGLHSERQ